MANIVSIEVNLGIGADNKTAAAKQARILKEVAQPKVSAVTVDYNSLSVNEKATFDAFVALIESKAGA